MSRFRFAFVLAALSALAATPPAVRAQRPISRSEAVRAALDAGPRLGIARADTSAAFARLITAGAFPNPTLSATYSKSAPQWHFIAEIPLDFPTLRSTRLRSAEAARVAAQYRYAFASAAAALDADTTYTRALAARAHAELSRRNAADADSLRRIAVRRRDAGDASDLDVELATVSAGQQANVAAADSLEYLSVLLDLQTVMGILADAVVVVPDDSLAPPADSAAVGAATPLEEAAAEREAAAADLTVRLERRSVFGLPSITAGVETGDPGGSEKGILPTVGIAVPFPLFDRHRGPILQAEAERERARAELQLARLEGRARIARAGRERAIASGKVARDRLLLASAARVAAMSITAYREGQSALPNVLEAQRNAREVLGQYIDDVAAAWIATASLRLFTLAAPERATR